jgi:hypothetical protein
VSVLRIFSYLPNPRIAKATIAARLCGVSLEVRGAPVQELQDWLWDFDAHPLSVEERDALRHCVRTGRTGFTSALYKTDAFLAAHPFGAVPAAFDPSGQIGIFESSTRVGRSASSNPTASCARSPGSATAACRSTAATPTPRRASTASWTPACCSRATPSSTCWPCERRR